MISTIKRSTTTAPTIPSIKAISSSFESLMKRLLGTILVFEVVGVVTSELDVVEAIFVGVVFGSMNISMDSGSVNNTNQLGFIFQGDGYMKRYLF